MRFEQEFSNGWLQAIAHLRGTSRRLSNVIDSVGPCTLSPRKDYFVLLCKAIFDQQLSMAAAATLFGRFRDLFPNRRPTPHALLALLAKDEQVLRSRGVSRQKNRYLKDLAEHFVSGQIPTRRLASMGDEAVIEALTAVNGIGRWSAEMFLIFTLNRPDVWPVDDLGLRRGAQLLFELRKPPELKKLIALGEPLRPWRTVATWYLWRGTDFLKR